MFRPFRILQVGFIAVLVVGCASHQTQAVAPSSAVAATPAASGGASPSLPPLAPSIAAGESTPGSAGFLQADGSLTPNIQAYAQEVAQVRSLPLPHVEAILKSARFNATAAKLMAPSGTRIRRSWVTYRNRFVEPVRIKAGVEFWTEHKAVLDQASRDYGVPQSVIVAIIGVETVYGRNTGNFRVLDALATLGFRYPDPTRPERSQLFRDQLADLIQLDYEKKLDARAATGSFAGAMGLPQFMPGSLMRYAADGDGDGRIDLLYNTTDAVNSVARFLRLHGWVPGLPVFAPASAPGNAKRLVAGGLYPTYEWPALQAEGATLIQGSGTTHNAWTQHKVGLVDLIDEPRNQAEYRIGTPNFFAITHYNRSYFYAASVADLAKALADRMGYAWPS